jgi:hypothetical protein
VVPAADLRVRVWHHRASRFVLPGKGEVHARLSIPACGHTTEMRVGAGSGAFQSVEVSREVLETFGVKDDITVVLEYVRGNTTYRVDEVRLDWTPAVR